jgi:tetratricopeptide (TPR) repeat protein
VIQYKLYSMKKIVSVIILFIAINGLKAQTAIELDFLKGNYHEVITATSGLSNADDYYWQAQALVKLGHNTQAILLLENGAQKFGHDSIASNLLQPLLAQVFHQAGMYHKALPLLYKFAHRPEIFPMLISVLEFSNRYSEAIVLTKEKLATDSLNADWWKKLGNQYYAVQQSDSAQYALDRALQLNPFDQSTAYLQISLLVKTKQYKDAVVLSNQILAIDSLNIKFINAKGLALFKNKNYVAAARCFSRSLELGDTSRFVRRHLGISQVIAGLYYDGIEHLSNVLIEENNDVEANFFMGKAYAFTDSCENGFFYLNKADSLMQPNAASLASIWMVKHDIYNSSGQHNMAIYCYEEAYKLTPLPEYLYYIANYYQYEMLNSEKALYHYERFLKALHVDPSDTTQLSDTAMVITPQGGTINMRKTAEMNIRSLKEELFFQNRLK